MLRKCLTLKEAWATAEFFKRAWSGLVLPSPKLTEECPFASTETCQITNVYFQQSQSSLFCFQRWSRISLGNNNKTKPVQPLIFPSIQETRLSATVCDMDLSTMNEMKLPHPEHMFHLHCASASPAHRLYSPSFISTLRAWSLLGSANSCCLKILKSAISWKNRYPASLRICSTISEGVCKVWTCCQFGFSSVWLQVAHPWIHTSWHTCPNVKRIKSFLWQEDTGLLVFCILLVVKGRIFFYNKITSLDCMSPRLHQRSQLNADSVDRMS